MALAQVDNLRPDPRRSTSPGLHDVAVGSGQNPTVGCFALLGARRARAFVFDRGATPELGECVHTAIARHMDPATPRDHGAEAALLHDAAHLDVTGLRAYQLDSRQLAAIDARHDRAGFAAEFTATMRDEARIRAPTAATLWRSGMRVAITLNPLDR